MSAARDEALASLTREALAPQTRRVRHPRTGRFCAITLEAELWRHLDALARDCGTSSTELCRTALLESPETMPADALWQLLCVAYIRPMLGASQTPGVH